MERFSTRARVRAFIVAGALATALVVPAAVSADTTPGSTGTASLTLASDVSVIGKVAAVVDVSFTCDPFLVYDWETGQYVPSTAGSLEFGNAALTQASGRSVASGSEALALDGPIVCDGSTPNHATSTIMATSLPWKKGTAVATVRVFVASSDFQSQDQGQVGPLLVKLTAR